jgi:hypothetical protein
LSSQPENYISLGEAAKLCDYTQEYLSLRARQGKLKAIKLGRNWVTTKDWLDDYAQRATEYNNVNGNGKTKEKKASFPPEDLPIGELQFRKAGFKDRFYELRFNLKPEIQNIRPALVAALAISLIMAGGIFGKGSLTQVYDDSSPIVKKVQGNFQEGLSVVDAKIDQKLLAVDSKLADYGSLLNSAGLAAVERVAGQTISVEGQQVTVRATLAGAAEIWHGYSEWISGELLAFWGDIKNSTVGRTYITLNNSIEEGLARDFNSIKTFYVSANKETEEFLFPLCRGIAQGYSRANDTVVEAIRGMGQGIKNSYVSVNNFLDEKIGGGIEVAKNSLRRIKDIVTAPWGEEKIVVEPETEDLSQAIEELRSELEQLKKEPFVVKRVEVERVVEQVQEITKRIETTERIVDEEALAQVWADIEYLEQEMAKRLYAPGGVISQTIYVTEPVRSPKIYQENGEIVLQTTGSGNIILSAATGLQLYGSQVVINSTSLLNPLVYIADSTKIEGDLTVAGSIAGGALSISSITATGDAAISGDASIGGSLTVSATTTLAVDEGYVGIATSTPSASLAVAGNIMGSGNLVLYGSATSTIAGPITSGSIYPSLDVTYYLGSPSYRWANIYAATSTFGGTIVVGSDVIRGSSTTTLTTIGNSNQLVLGADGNVGIGTSTMSGLLTVGTSTPSLVVAANGYVGISTTTPSYALEVSGTVKTDDFITKGPWVDVRAFGAEGDGVADDTDAVNAALASLGTQGGTIYFPPGIYLVGDITVSQNSVIIQGAGRALSSGIATSTTEIRAKAGSTRSLYITGNNVVIKDLYINGNGNAVQFEVNGPYCIIDNIYSSGHTQYQLNRNSTGVCRINNSSFIGQVRTISNAINITGNYFNGNGAVTALTVDGGANVVIHGNTFESYTTAIAMATSGASFVVSANITSNYFESSFDDNSSVVQIGHSSPSSYSVNILNNYFGATDADYFINASYLESLVIQGNNFHGSPAVENINIGSGVNKLVGSTNRDGDANGVLGVGTSTPRYLLDVWGDLAVGTSTDSNTPVLYVKSGTGYGSVGIGTTTPTGLLTVGTTTSALVVTDSGKVGIGTTTPAEALSVVGNIVGTGNITVTGDYVTLSGDIMPASPRSSDIGSPAYDWANIYVDNVYANNILAASSSIAGTIAEMFTINSDAASDATSTLRFYRGTDTPHALLNWDAGYDRFNMNFPLYLSGTGNIEAAVALNLTGNSASIWKTTSGSLTVQSADNFTASSTGYVILSTAGEERVRITEQGNVGIGTSTPAYTLDVSGTIRGQNFVTAGGSPVNDILLPQDVQNYSINSLTGTLGADIIDWEEKVSATEFESAEVYNVSATPLTNGNVFVAYSDNGNSGYGTFTIYDPSGVQVKAPTVFESGSIGIVSATTLTNGNVLIAYNDQDNFNYGTFVIYDSAGNQVKAPTVFNGGDAYNLSTATLTNGNTVIVYRDSSNSDYGTFVIYDSNGNLVKESTVFEYAGVYENISAVALTNGNFFLAYMDSGNSGYGTYAIYDSAGNQVKAPALIESAYLGQISAAALNNGNVLITYYDTNNSNYGTFVIYDSVGNQVKAPALIGTIAARGFSTTPLTNGNVLIAYYDQDNSSYGTFVIYDSAGNQVKAPTVFESAETTNISATVLTNGNVFIAYSNVDNSYHGNFVIWQGTGTNLSRRLTVSGTTTLSSSLVVDTDTLYVDSFTDKVGIGTSTPSGKLSVAGNILGSGNIVLYGSATSTISGPLELASPLRTAGNIYPASDVTYTLGSPTHRWANIYAATGTFGGTITIDTDDIRATGALNLTGAAASTWQVSGGALTVQADSQNLTIKTLNSGNIAITSAGSITETFAAAGEYSLIHGSTVRLAFDSSGNLMATGTTIAFTGNTTITGAATTTDDFSAQGNIWGSGNLVLSGTINTGQGATEVYLMNQDVQTTDAVTFVTVNTGHGDNELYAMDQAVRTTDSVTFGSLNLTYGLTSASSTFDNLTINSTTTSGTLAVGTSNLYVSENGNVGIGTTTPAAALEVAGLIRSTVAGFSGLELVSGTGLQWQLLNSAAASNSFSIWEDGTQPRFTILEGGNVGIGTTTPNAALEIHRVSNSANLVLNSSGAGQNAIFFSDGSVKQTQFTSNFSDDKFYLYHQGGNRLVINASGNIGIGTDAPSSKLTVSGGDMVVGSGTATTTISYNQSTFASNIAVSGTATSTIAGPLTVRTNQLVVNESGNIGMGTATPGAKLDVAGGINLAGNLDFDSNARLITDIYQIQGETGRPLYVVAKSNQEMFFRTQTSIGEANRLVIPSGSDTVNVQILNSNVGIGTTAPSSKLTVSGGNFSISAAGTATSTIYGSTTATSTIISGLSAGNNAALVVNQAAAANSLYVAANGNVGIGVTDPGAALHIKGGNDNTLFIDNDGSRYTAWYLRNNGTNKVQSYWDNDNALFVLGTVASSAELALTTGDNEEAIRIDSSGNVGIGTTAPSSKLTVFGGNLVVGNGSATSTITNGEINLDYGISAATGTIANLTVTATTTSGTLNVGSGNLYVSENGNVGIGTTTPGYTLDVDGIVNSTALYVNGSPYIGSQWTTLDNDIYYTTGNVGIGTVTPYAKLTINESDDFAFGFFNGNVIDNMDDVILVWLSSNATVSTSTETSIVKTGSQSLNITASGVSEDVTVKNTLSSAQDWSSYERIGFWIRTDRFATSTATSTQLISFQYHDSGGVINTHNVTFLEEDRWQYEEVALTSTITDKDAIDYVQFRVDFGGTGDINFYIDQIRLYDDDERTADMFVDKNGILTITGRGGVEIYAPQTGAGSLPGVRVDGAVVELGQPLSVNTGGNVGFDYDLEFLNTGLSQITSEGPLRIAAGPSYRSYNLTLASGGTGDVIIELSQASSSMMITQAAYATTTSFIINSEANATSTYLMKAYSDVNSDENVVFAVDAAGNLTYDGTASSPASDVAENYKVADESIKVGDVVCLAESGGLRVEKCSEPYQETMLGVISTRPAVLMGGALSDSKPVALNGRVPVTVSGENGPIYIGDPLTSASSTPGVAMKATGSGKIFGYALAPFDGTATSTSKILAFVNLERSSGGDLTVVQDEDGIKVSTIAGGTSTAVFGIDGEGALVVSKLKADEIETQGITIYDRITGDPYCITMENGEINTAIGKCNIAGVGEALSEAIGGDSPQVCTNGEDRPCGADTCDFELGECPGVCEIGVQVCEDGEWGECMGAVMPSNEICDEVDNDCDGEVDEGDTYDGTAGEGASTTTDSTSSTTTTEPICEPTEEMCDGVDNDCDGVIDEDLIQQCGSSDVGACQYGTQTCSAGIWGECAGAVEPAEEVCGDSLDNDCDGETDEDGVCDGGTGEVEPLQTGGSTSTDSAVTDSSTTDSTATSTGQ